MCAAIAYFGSSAAPGAGSGRRGARPADRFHLLTGRHIRRHGHAVHAVPPGPRPEGRSVISGTHNKSPAAHLRLRVLRGGQSISRLPPLHVRDPHDPGRVPAAPDLTHENVLTRLGDHLDTPRCEARVRRLQPPLQRELPRPEVRVRAARRPDDGVAPRGRRRRRSSFDHFEIVGPWVLLAHMRIPPAVVAQPRHLARHVPLAHSADRLLHLSEPVEA